jgi:mono/diheme cytochrome c family protein
MIEKYLDTEELKRLLSSLSMILGGLVVAGLFASIVVPGLRNANKPETPTLAARITGETGWLDLTEFPPERGKIIPPVDPQTLMMPSGELLDRGKTLYEQNCMACHGERGLGDGPAASTINPRPRNLTDSSGWVNAYDLPGIYRTLSEGINGTSMNAFDYLSRKDRMALVHFVQSLGEFSHETQNTQALEDLSEELASPGGTTSNKIPVSMAMRKLEEEFTVPVSHAFGGEGQSPEEKLLRRVIINPSRAVQVLVQSRAWQAGDQELAGFILPDLPANGFSISTATLTPSEWKMLHAELLKRFKTE